MIMATAGNTIMVRIPVVIGWIRIEMVRTRKSSRHKKKVSEILNDHGHSKKRTRGTDSSAVRLDKDRDGDGQYSHRMKSSGRRNKVHESPDDHWDGNRTHDSDSSGDWFDRDRHHARTRKLSMHSNEATGFSDNCGELEKKLEDKSHHREPDLNNCGRSSREASDGDFADEDLKPNGNHETSSSGRYGQRTGSHGLRSRYNFDGNIDEGSHHESGYDFPEKHQNSKRKFRSDEIYESDCPDRYDRRNDDNDGDDRRPTTVTICCFLHPTTCDCCCKDRSNSGGLSRYMPS
ncbi:hypothetical protein F0562_020216 [Nyssa sinensis]|uniref:Uncharacterized protein n=1 Tax=Nyssa sinensis TaxID=561372 RepID=A0A5J5BV29_9ASTE|nr:hypothetical protein F0562_020216 [Nyssa sinensis]